MQAKKRRPAKIALEADKGELVITWKDGEVSRRPLAYLRRNCPCASCRALRAQAALPPATGELPVLSDEAARATAEAAGFELVGRYGIRIRWADGHDYGIYTFEFLESGENA